MEAIEQTTLEITPQSAVKWASHKRELSLELIRAKYNLAGHEQKLAAYEVSIAMDVLAMAGRLPSDDKSLSSEDKRKHYVQKLLNESATATELRGMISDVQERIAFIQVEHAYASDMFKITLEFVFFEPSPGRCLAEEIDRLISTTPAGREAAVTK